MRLNQHSFTSGWFWHAPEYFNKWRVFSRLFVITYMWLLYESANWFMALTDPSTAQSAFVGVIITGAAGFFGLYVNSSDGNSKIVTDVVLSPYDRAMQEKLNSQPTTQDESIIVTTEYKPRIINNSDSKG